MDIGRGFEGAINIEYFRRGKSPYEETEARKSIVCLGNDEFGAEEIEDSWARKGGS